MNKRVNGSFRPRARAPSQFGHLWVQSLRPGLWGTIIGSSWVMPLWLAVERSDRTRAGTERELQAEGDAGHTEMSQGASDSVGGQVFCIQCSPWECVVSVPFYSLASELQWFGYDCKTREGMATHPGTLTGRVPTDRGAWWATVHGVAKSRTRLSG